MQAIEHLLAIEEIKKLKARYFRCVDTKDWEVFRRLFAPDALLDISEDVPGGKLVGPHAIADAASRSLRDCVSVHHGHCPEIDLISDCQASGVWAMEDMLRWPAAAGAALRTLHGYGHYFESYEKIGGRWVIKAMKLRRLRVDIVDQDEASDRLAAADRGGEPQTSGATSQSEVGD
jgi:hypothetical protein